jgi:hypothetical protein
MGDEIWRFFDKEGGNEPKFKADKRIEFLAWTLLHK